MNCSKCSNEMVKGNILGDRYALKWMPGDKKLLGGVFASKDSITLKKNSLMGRPKTEAFVCHDCGTLVIDLNEQQA